ncbi:Nuclear receptor 2C2-associated protein [Lamellibrachia satsuma]|nr:Nuclear receptor 2C2-associated protein [Lamellibrachia satsuma]
MSSSLICEDTNIRVSSVLNRDVKQFGKKHMFDNDDETCWNSDQGSPQWVYLDFKDLVQLDSIQMRFQGGFAGKHCQVEHTTDDCDKWTRIMDFYPEDVNSLQIFKLPTSTNVKRLRVVFLDSTDFYGRITIYELCLLGCKT